MIETVRYKLIVYQPAICTEQPSQTGFEYELTVTPRNSFRAVKGKLLEAVSADCEVVPLTGALSFPNPAAPVISNISGLLFIYSSPAIGFPLQLVGINAEPILPVEIQMVFTNSAASAVGGVIRFGAGWSGPFNNVTASFLGQVAPNPGAC
jgi:hypothetical protein